MTSRILPVSIEMQWTDTRLKGFWQMVLDKIPFHAFMRMRLVCTLFYRISPDICSQWYGWLCIFGEGTYSGEGHRDDVRCNALKCNIPRHQINLCWRPVIRVTRPLHLQVFQQVLRKRIKRDLRKSKRLYNEKISLERSLVTKRRAYDVIVVALSTSQDDLKSVDTQLAQKRVRLTISNFQ